MYSQYQSYQPTNQSMTSQGAMTYNGTSWVSTPAPVASSTYSTYEQPSKPVSQSLIPSNPVETYTEYYHSWLAHGKECEEYLRHLPRENEGQRAETQRRVEWAKFYADESSRAAHHFYSNPNATSAPFELPPAPPKQQAQQQSPVLSQQPAVSQVKQQQQQLNGAQRSDDQNTPSGLARYVKRCLDQCDNPNQRKAVQAQVEKVIAEAIQNGDLHLKNWESVPLIPVPMEKLSFSISPQPPSRRGQNSFNRGQTANSSNYYGPSGNNHGGGRPRYDDKLPANDSYYGRPGGKSQNFSLNIRSTGQSDNYYGPVSYDSNTASNAEDSLSPLSSQKRVISPEEDFISFQQKRKNKKQKKNGDGFEKSTQALTKRANRFSGPGGIRDASASASTVNGHDRYMGKKLTGGSNRALTEDDYCRMTVVGTCQKLDKEYLRLTAPPKAELVRPKPILERHLANLKRDYAAKKRDYLWFCSQLKAMRQDCTVQRIQSEFTVDVYEYHARIALQEGDLNEYNQCQTQLKELYESGYTMGNEDEFIAYRLLYYVFLSTNEKYDGGSSDMFKILLQLTPGQKNNPAIAHALKTREAMTSGDYIQFFRIHKDSPGLSRSLTDLMVPTMRMRGLRRMVKAYRPSLGISVFKGHLGFDSIGECSKFLVRCGCVVEGSNCSTKDSDVHEPLEEKKNSLI